MLGFGVIDVHHRYGLVGLPMCVWVEDRALFMTFLARNFAHASVECKCELLLDVAAPPLLLDSCSERIGLNRAGHRLRMELNLHSSLRVALGGTDGVILLD